MEELVMEEIERLTNLLRQAQSRNGSWAYPFETGISTDAYMIILLRTLRIDDEKLIQALVERIERKQVCYSISTSYRYV